jgi:hypothetical protein
MSFFVSRFVHGVNDQRFVYHWGFREQGVEIGEWLFVPDGAHYQKKGLGNCQRRKNQAGVWVGDSLPRIGRNARVDMPVTGRPRFFMREG